MKKEQQSAAAAGQPSPAAEKKRAPKKPPVPGVNRGDLARRKFVWMSVFGLLSACAVATGKFFYPRALFEPKTRFVIGYPGTGALALGREPSEVKRMRCLSSAVRSTTRMPSRWK